MVRRTSTVWLRARPRVSLPCAARPEVRKSEAGRSTLLAIVPIDDRAANRHAKLVEVDPVTLALEALVLDPALECLGLGGAEEVPVEEQLEDPPVLLRLGDG